MYGIQIAFKTFDFGKGIWKSPWIGVENFKLLFIDHMYWRAFFNTIIISLLKLTFVFPAPIILAILINEMKSGRYKRVLQTAYTFPHFLSWVIISGIVFNLLNSTGPINSIRLSMGMDTVAFLGNRVLFRPLLLFTDIMKESGWDSIIYLAAIASINEELYEASVIDGANRWQKIWHITLPGINPTIALLFILSVGNVLNANFDQIFNLYNSVVYEVADVIPTYIYRITFQGAGSGDFAFSTAAGLFQSVINLFLILLANHFSSKFGEHRIF